MALTIMKKQQLYGAHYNNLCTMNILYHHHQLASYKSAARNRNKADNNVNQKLVIIKKKHIQLRPYI